MSTVPARRFLGRDLALELLDPDEVKLTRLYKRLGGDWDPPEPQYRTLRVDPPAGQEDRFAVLYTGDCVQVVAAECRILVAKPDETYVWAGDQADIYQVARYSYDAPALFIPIDGDNRRVLGLDGPSRMTTGYALFQNVALELYERFGTTVHGLSWESFHRNQLGRVYAIWHDRKDAMSLQLDMTGASASLTTDAAWNDFLVANPHTVKEIRP